MSGDEAWVLGNPETAYTLGNPQTYERALDEAGADGVTKCIGGVAYRTLAEAQAAIDRARGCLPPEWFGGRRLPGKVYALVLPDAWEVCVVPAPELGAHALMVEAAVRRVVQ